MKYPPDMSPPPQSIIKQFLTKNNIKTPLEIQKNSFKHLKLFEYDALIS